MLGVGLVIYTKTSKCHFLKRYLQNLAKQRFTSYQYPLLSYIKRQIPNATVGFISPPISDWMNNEVAYEVIKSNLILGEIDVIHAPAHLYNQQFVDELHALGLKVHFGLCDTEEKLKKAFSLGADELTTNDIALAVYLF